MKKHLEKLHKERAAVMAATSKIEELTARLDTLRGQMEDLRVSATDKTEIKDRILDQFVRGEASQADVDRAREDCDRALSTLKDTEELLAATERVFGEVKRTLPGLGDRVVIVERELWQAVYEHDRAEIVKVIGNKFWRCFAAKAKTGNNSYSMGFITDIFGPLRTEQIQALSDEMQHEILG